MKPQSIDFYDHPLFHPYHMEIDTPGKQRLKTLIDRWLWTGITGGVIKGESRSGKTTTMLDLTQRFETRGGRPIPAFYFTVPDRDRKTIKALYRTLSISANLPLHGNVSVENMFKNLVSFFVAQLSKTNSKHFILVVDEGQRLSFAQYNVFAEFHDFMREKFKVLFTVIFVVNSDEAVPIFDQIISPKYKHIHGRFFKNIALFQGLCSKNDVHYCLTQYDHLRFPDPEGPTYSEFFCPAAVRQGWQYSDLSALVWSTFRAYQTAYKLGAWGMESFICTANILLYDFLSREDTGNCDADMVRAAIDASGLIPSLVRPCK